MARRNRRRTATPSPPAPSPAALVLAATTRARPPAPASPPAVPDVGALVRAELARHRDAEQEAERRRFRHPAGGGCAKCGVNHSAQRAPGGPVPGWSGRGRLAVCAWCQADRRHWGDSDDEHRIRRAAWLLGLTRDDGQMTWKPIEAYGPVLTAMRWFSETPGAEPSHRRFAYVDLAALRRVWNTTVNPRPTPSPEPKFKRWDPCPLCGVTDRWHADGPHWARPAPGGFWYTCTACRALPDDVDRHVASITGLSPVAGLAAALGLSWWAHADRSRPPTEPLGWWPSHDEIRARARELWPDDQAYRAWRRPRSWPAAKVHDARQVGTKLDEIAARAKADPDSITAEDAERARELAGRYRALDR